jgi:hypothetical protein
MLTNEVAKEVMSIDIHMISQEPMEPKGIQVRSIFSYSIVKNLERFSKTKLKALTKLEIIT